MNSTGKLRTRIKLLEEQLIEAKKSIIKYRKWLGMNDEFKVEENIKVIFVGDHPYKGEIGTYIGHERIRALDDKAYPKYRLENGTECFSMRPNQTRPVNLGA